MTDTAKNKYIKAFSDLVGLFDSKPRAAATVAMILVILYLFLDNKELNKRLIDDNEKWRTREVEMYQKLINRYDPKMNAIETKVDTIKITIDSSSSKIQGTAEKINKVVKKMDNIMNRK